MKKILMVLAVLAVASTASAQMPTLFIEPSNDGFDAFITAAMFKKQVPLLVTVNQENASFTLKSSAIEVNKQSGASKIARCLFAYCAGINDSSNISVTLISNEGIAVWSYAVKKGKGGAGNRQSMAESIAKHLKKDFLKVRD